MTKLVTMDVRDAPPLPRHRITQRLGLAATLAFAGVLAAGVFGAHELGASNLQPNQLEQLSERTQDLTTRVDALERLVQYSTYVVPTVLFLLTVAGVFGYSTLRGWAKKGVENTLERLSKTEVDAQLPKVLESALQKAEQQILRLAKLLALRASKAYDDALEEFGWAGKVSEIRSESPVFRRALIDCLYNAKTNQKKNREDAWTAVTELLSDDQSLDTLNLALKICVSGRRFDDGAAILERHRSSIENDKETAMYAATLLRRRGQLREALALAERFREGGDFQSLVTIAALKRELGRFDEAQDILWPAVQRIISYAGEYPRPAWFRVLNTYVANCQDRHRPEDAVRAAYYILQSVHGGVELFTVGRLIHRLPAIHAERAELLDLFKAAIRKLVESEARVKCEVTLAEVEGRVADAIAALQKQIESSEGDLDGKKRQMDAYFHRSHLAQIYLKEKDGKTAIDVVLPACQWEYGGEAKYYAAVAYAMEGRPDDAVIWLRQAIHEAPRWGAMARDDIRLSAHQKIAELLAESPPIGSGQST